MTVRADGKLVSGLMTSGQVARELRCSIWKVQRIERDQLPFMWVGKHRRYDPADVAAYLARMRSGA